MKTKTLAAVLEEINKPLQIEELILPELKPGQVLVKVSYSGLCHSQLNEILGLKGPDKFLPHTLGHEGSGVVMEVGPGVTKVKAGDHVVLTWIKGTGCDIPSSRYKRNDASEVNSGAIATFIEFAVISENRLVPIPGRMPLREASLLGCSFLTGAGMVMNTAKVEPGSSVAVFGAGGIGLSAIMAASLMNAKTIIGVDSSHEKLIKAMEVGATHVTHSDQKDPLTGITEITGGSGVDYALEATGNRQAMETAFRSVRPGGGLCILAGNLPQGEHISLNPMELIQGKNIRGTWGGESQPDRDIPRYVDLYLAGKLKLNSLITRTWSLQEINLALEYLDKGNVGRGLIDLTP